MSIGSDIRKCMLNVYMAQLLGMGDKIAFVRRIFSRYLALRPFRKLTDELSEAGIVTKRREIADHVCGAIPFIYDPSPAS